MMSKIENLKNLSILYADDDEVLRESTVKILSMLFNTVYSAKDGEEAIEIFNANENINIMMLDIKMKSTSGIDVAKFIRAKNKTVPIFLVSSYTETADLIEACKLNLVDYIKKPFSFNILSTTLLECLSKIEEHNTILQKISKDYPAQVIEVELERKSNGWIYEIKQLSADGSISKLEVDAKTGIVLKQKSKK